MIAGVLKVSPVAALLATLSIKNVALFIAVATAVSGVLALGAVVTMAKAWRERAEARTDEALQLEDQMRDRDARITTLELRIEELELRPDLRGIRTADADEHRAIIASVDRLADRFGSELAANTTAIKTLSDHVPWGDIVAPPRSRSGT